MKIRGREWVRKKVRKGMRDKEGILSAWTYVSNRNLEKQPDKERNKKEVRK